MLIDLEGYQKLADTDIVHLQFNKENHEWRTRMATRNVRWFYNAILEFVWCLKEKGYDVKVSLDTDKRISIQIDNALDAFPEIDLRDKVKTIDYLMRVSAGTTRILSLSQALEMLLFASGSFTVQRGETVYAWDQYNYTVCFASAHKPIARASIKFSFEPYPAQLMYSVGDDRTMFMNIYDNHYMVEKTLKQDAIWQQHTKQKLKLLSPCPWTLGLAPISDVENGWLELTDYEPGGKKNMYTTPLDYQWADKCAKETASLPLVIDSLFVEKLSVLLDALNS